MRPLVAIALASFFATFALAERAAAAPACDPTSCGAGTYCDEGGTWTCQPCLANCDSCSDATTCFACAPEHWFLPIPIGGGPAECLACTVCQPGEVEVLSCDFGHDRQCASSCPAGKYEDNGVCTSCGVTDCAQCATAGSCTACAAGYRLDSGSCVACTSCPAGKRIDAACSGSVDTVCVDCEANTFSNAADSMTCTACADGTSAPQGATACTVVCGDGRKATSEACDDGDTQGGDGCAADCSEETGWVCTEASANAPSVCVEMGNGTGEDAGMEPEPSSDSEGGAVGGGGACASSAGSFPGLPRALLPLAFALVAWRRRRKG